MFVLTIELLLVLGLSFMLINRYSDPSITWPMKLMIFFAWFLTYTKIVLISLDIHAVAT